MSGSYIINKLFLALSDLTDNDLRRLLSILRRNDAITELAKVVESILSLRRIERPDAVRWQEGQDAESSLAGEGPSEKSGDNESPNGRSFDELERAIQTLLDNRQAFPTTKDVVDVVNSEFQCGIDYDSYRKRGRRDVIKRCRADLQLLPKRKQISLMKAFFQKHAEMDKYARLFKILAGYEQNPR